MKTENRTIAVISSWVILMTASAAVAQDWPQWRGSNRDAKAAGFKAPAAWPKELTQKWKITVGEGVATPALVGNKIYVFARQEGHEIVLCLDAGTGKEVWQDKYESAGASGPASAFSGPRSSPTVADGKVVTLGVRGMLSCLDAAVGKKLWRKDDFQGWPQFHPSSSPLVVDGLCIAQLGGKEKGERNGKDNGAIVAYDLATGDQKWKWSGESPSYASPVVMTVNVAKLIVTLTERKIVAVDMADGKLAWEAPFAGQGMGGYNAATPIVDGQTIIYSGAGRGVKAVKIEKAGDSFSAKELWSNPDKSVQFNTPVLKNGVLYGLTQRYELFCINAQNGQTAWSAPLPQSGGGGGFRPPTGSIVDAGSVLMALTPGSELIVFEPSDKAYKQLASYKVAETPTHAHPVLSGNRIFIKDKESVALWTID
jgi:outer membrane protein assembly factor BamB